MPANLTIKIPPGVVRTSTDGFTRGRWWDASLVRWRGSHLLPIGGWSRLSSAPLASTGREIHVWRDLADARRVAIGGDAGLYLLDGAALITVTLPAGFVPLSPVTTSGGYGLGLYNDGTYNTPRAGSIDNPYVRYNIWSLDNFGEDLMAVASSDGRLLRLPANSTTAAVVTAAPTGARAMLVTEERHVMMFGEAANPRRVLWSDRENYNNWNFADTTNAAGFFDLDSGSSITNAMKVRGGILLWTESECWFVRYVGQPFIYSFERIGQGCGLYGPNGVAVAGSTAVWMGKSNFWRYDGGSVRPLPCDVENYVFSQVDELYGPNRVHAATNGIFPEFWFFYPSANQTECNRYVVWSPEGNWWSIGALPRTAMLGAGAYPYPLMSGVDGHIYMHEDGWSDNGAARTGQVYVESAAFTGEGAADIIHVLQAQMDSGHGYDATRFRAYSRFTRDGSERAFGPYTPRPDGYADCRFSGRDLRLRIEATKDADWSVGEVRFLTEARGRR
jgi:hypothetical protein